MFFLDISQVLPTQSSYSEAETSSMDSTLGDLSRNNDHHIPLSTNVFSPSDILEQSEKRHNPYITSSVSMRSVSSNVVNENSNKRPSSLPVFRQNGK